MANRSYLRTQATNQSSSKDLPLNRIPTRSFGLQAKPEITEGENQHLSSQSTSFGHDFTTTPFLQAKLTIGAPGDQYEQEADRVAAQVVQQINAPQGPAVGTVQRNEANHEEEKDLQTKPVISTLQRQEIPEEEEKELQTKSLVQCQEIPEEEKELQTKSLIQRQEIPEEEEKELQTKSLLQRRSPESETASTDLESSINSARGNGQPLDSSVRGSMEQAFGTNFSGVRVHTDTHSDQLNRAVQARAFTTGRDIFFRQGEYQPGNRGGQELLAHELTHVVQQSSTNLAIQRENPTGTLETSRGLEDIEGITVTGDSSAFNSDCQNGLRQASTRVRTHINAFGIEILNAISAFKDYTDSKISDLEGEVTGQGLLNSLISVALSAIPIPGAGRLVEALGKELGDAIISELRSRLTTAAQDATTSSSEKELKKVVTSLVAAARDSSTAMRERAGTEFDSMINPLITKLQAGEALTSVEDEIVSMFYQARTDVMDEYLSSQFGIPVADSLIDLHVNLFSNLVQGFEEEIFSATASLRDQIYWSTVTTDVSGREGYARHQARLAGRTRRRQLEGG